MYNSKHWELLIIFLFFFSVYIALLCFAFFSTFNRPSPLFSSLSLYWFKFAPHVSRLNDSICYERSKAKLSIFLFLVFSMGSLACHLMQRLWQKTSNMLICTQCSPRSFQFFNFFFCTVQETNDIKNAHIFDLKLCSFGIHTVTRRVDVQ